MLIDHFFQKFKGDTGNPSGISLSRHLQVPFAEGFIRHQYAGRAFIMAGSEKSKRLPFKNSARFGLSLKEKRFFWSMIASSAALFRIGRVN